MIDTNYALRKAYFSALSGISAPVYYQAAPPNQRTSEYVVFKAVTNKGDGTKTTSDTRTFITIEIYSFANSVNSGKRVDEIADEILQAVYPDRQSKLALDNGQIVTTEMTFDLTNPYQVISGEVYLSRYLTFRHFIYQ